MRDKLKLLGTGRILRAPRHISTDKEKDRSLDLLLLETVIFFLITAEIYFEILHIFGGHVRVGP
jgi:hypothetical protein